MHDTDQPKAHTPPEEPLESVAPGVSLLESILLLLTPEQQQHFLESAGVYGVVYANRAPTFDKPLALKLTKRAFTELRGMLGNSTSNGSWDEQSDFDDPGPIEALKEELQAGVRFAPPPLNWFKDHPEGEDVPIRVETQRFGIPCRLCRDRYSSGSYLLATFIGPPDTRRDSEETDAEADDPGIEALTDPIDVEHLSAVVDEPSFSDTQEERQFVPHVHTVWDVLGPYAADAPDIDAAALERLVLQIATNRRYNALSRNTRERCDVIEGLLRLKQFASQYPYVLAGQAGDSFEFEVTGPRETVNAIKRAYLYRDAADGSRRDRVAGIVLEHAGRRRKYQVFRAPEGFQCDPPPASGYLVDAGDISQLQKQLDALRELRHPSSRPHLIQLGTLLSSNNGNMSEHVNWEATPIHLVDGKLTERQAEAVQKALATPDVCLIQGPPGTGKTRVISEIVRQAVRKNWKVLLVAPTHVAVDNVLERIGMQEEVSPVRCVRQEKLEKLPDHIQEFTYERRSGLLAHETVRRTEAERSRWQERTKQLASALEVLAQVAGYRDTANQLERSISELRRARSQVPTEVQDQFANETELATGAEDEAKTLLADTETELEASRRGVDLRHRRIGELQEHQYTADDRQRFDQAAAAVREEDAPAIEAATSDLDRTSATLAELKNVEAERQHLLDTGRATLGLLDKGEVPPIVQDVIDAAVTDTTHEHNALVNARLAELESTKNEYADTQRRIADLERKANGARSRARSLEATKAKALPLRVFSSTWWGSFFTDYERTATEAFKQSTILQGQCPALEARVRQHEQSHTIAAVERREAIEAARCRALEHQHDHYRSLVAELPAELASIRSDRQDLEVRLQAQRTALENLNEACRHHIEEAWATVHSELLKVAHAELDAAQSRLANAEARLEEAQQRLATAQAQIAAVADRLRKTVESRTSALTRDLRAREHELAEVRDRFEAAIAPLRDVRPTLPAFESESINAARLQLQTEHERARRRLKLLDQWAQYLGRDSENLTDRLSQYVNLVCATTVGIATDEYFGDRGAFVERDFDLLVVDEAGKVTEPEFLVAAVRATRWVLVGDHKQLPPYYEQVLDPYIRSANDTRRVSNQTQLDSDVLRMSIFERLWCKYDPQHAHVNRESTSHSSDPSSATPRVDSAPHTDPRHSRAAAFDNAMESREMWQEHQAERAWTERRREMQMDQMWAEHEEDASVDQESADRRVGHHSTSTQALHIGENSDAIGGHDAQGKACYVTLDVQRRMHPDLAVFVSDMFYDGRYYSPDDDAYRQSKTLDLAHFPKPVTFIDICAGQCSDEYEVDLGDRDQRKSVLAEHAAELPERGYANLREAEQVIQVLEAVTDDPSLEREQAELDRDADQVPVVGVIALYAGQVALIHRLIRTSNRLRCQRASESDWLCGNMRISVNTVDAFQGKECPVIILSFTRSNRRQAVGFVNDANRLNVALSRARKKLILIGDSATLTRRAKEQISGGKDSRATTTERECFVRLLRYVERHGKTMRVFEPRHVS